MISLGVWGGLKGDDPYQPPGILWERGIDLQRPRFFPLDGGGAIGVGFTVDGYVIARIDSAGEIVWSRSAPGLLPHPPNPTLSGNQFVLPFKVAGKLHVVSMSAEGNTLWEKPILDPSIAFPTWAFRTSRGSFLLAGQVESKEVLLELSADGTSYTVHYLQSSPEIYDELYGVQYLEPLPAGGALLNVVGQAGGIERWLKLDPAGGVEWDIYPFKRSWYKVRGTMLGEFVRAEAPFSNQNSFSLSRFASDGKLRYSKPFDVSINGADFRPLRDEGLILSGSALIGADSHSDIQLIRTDARGEILWRLSVWPGGGGGPTVSVEPDGSFLVLLEGVSTSIALRTEPDPVLRPAVSFIRGDANGDGAVDIADPVATLGFLFLGDAAPGCLEAANTNDDGEVDISDAVHTLNYLFVGGAPIPPPFPEKGTDPTPGAPGCFST